MSCEERKEIEEMSGMIKRARQRYNKCEGKPEERANGQSDGGET